MTKRHNGKTILIIEDEAEIQNFASRVLQLEGYLVLQARDGNMGIKMATEEPVSLVLLDQHLPGRDGWSVLAEMKDEPALSMIPVVMLSASAGIAPKERALSMGAADYLVKPLSADKLRKVIANVVNRKIRTIRHAN